MTMFAPCNNKINDVIFIGDHDYTRPSLLLLNMLHGKKLGADHSLRIVIIGDHSEMESRKVDDKIFVSFFGLRNSTAHSYLFHEPRGHGPLGRA